MKLYIDNPAAQAQVEVLAPYYPYGVQVVHPVHGVGTLLGFGYARLGETIKVRCHFPEAGEMDDCYEAADIKPLLYQLGHGEQAIIDLVTDAAGQVEAINKLRSQHFAVGLRSEQYIRKTAA